MPLELFLKIPKNKIAVFFGSVIRICLRSNFKKYIHIFSSSRTKTNFLYVFFLNFTIFKDFIQTHFQLILTFNIKNAYIHIYH